MFQFGTWNFQGSAEWMTACWNGLKSRSIEWFVSWRTSEFVRGNEVRYRHPYHFLREIICESIYTIERRYQAWCATTSGAGPHVFVIVIGTFAMLPLGR